MFLFDLQISSPCTEYSASIRTLLVARDAGDITVHSVRSVECCAMLKAHNFGTLGSRQAEDGVRRTFFKASRLVTAALWPAQA